MSAGSVSKLFRALTPASSNTETSGLGCAEPPSSGSSSDTRFQAGRAIRVTVVFLAAAARTSAWYGTRSFSVSLVSTILPLTSYTQLRARSLSRDGVSGSPVRSNWAGSALKRTGTSSCDLAAMVILFTGSPMSKPFSVTVSSTDRSNLTSESPWFVTRICRVSSHGLARANEPSDRVVNPSESSACAVTVVFTACATSRNPAPASDSG